MTANAATSAAVAAAQGSDPTTAAAMGGLIPVVGAATSAAAKGLEQTGTRFVRAAMKPAVTLLKQQPGSSFYGLDNVADDLATFVMKNRITTPEKAQAIIDAAESEIRSSVGNQPTDAPARAARYLDALKRNAARAGARG
ncbi:MAG: hypothetical protein QM736_20555 [Vicinamibacterales bacterium]